jgi:uncharacterized protein DUF3857
MRSPHSILPLLATFVCLVIGASAHSSDNDWRPIDPAELASKTPIVEKDADAEALFWEVRLDDSQVDEFSLRHYLRIKIFTERGKESQSKVDIPYFSGTQVKDIAARVIKPDGSISELKKEDVFDRTIVKASGVKLKAKSFALPGIEPGAIIEYRWREVIPGGSADKLRIQFQREIPVVNVSYYLKPFQGMRYMPFHLGDARFVKDKDGFSKITASNLPAFREEPMSPPENELRSWLFLYFSDDKNLDVDKYWKDYGRAIWEGAKGLMKADSDVKAALPSIIGDAKSDEEKLRNIYDFCRTKIKNTSDDASGLTDDDRKKLKENKSPADTLKRAMGRASDIDFLFGALAQGAGFEARLALSGSRDDIFFAKTLANSYFLGASFIAVKVADKWEFFSPAEKYTEFGMLGWPEEDAAAMISDPKEPFWVSTPMSGPEKSVEKRSATFRLLDDGTLEGDVKIEYSGHLGFDQKEYNDDDSVTQREETLKQSVKKRVSTAELSEIKIENVEDPIKPFTYSYHIRVPGYAQRTGKRIFLQPGFFTHGVGSLFPATTRKYDVYFHYPWSEKDHVTIELPHGFVLDNADTPASITPEMTHRISALTIKMGSNGQVLIYDRDFFFGGGNSILFPVTGYSGVKQLFDILNSADDHTITLKQSASN